MWSQPRAEGAFSRAHHLLPCLVDPLHAVSFPDGQFKGEGYGPWPGFVGAGPMVIHWTKTVQLLISSWSPYLPRVHPWLLPAQLLVLDLCPLRREYVPTPWEPGKLVRLTRPLLGQDLLQLCSEDWGLRLRRWSVREGGSWHAERQYNTVAGCLLKGLG